MSARLHGRVALVAGASGGIGAAVARLLRREGAWVGLVARRVAPLQALAAETGGVALPADTTDEAALAAVVAEASAHAGAPVDIVVNAAGAFELAPIAETSAAQFRRLVEANLVGPFLLMRATLPGMLERRRGHVVTIGSVAGRHAFPNNGAYSAGKFGVRGLHAVLDAELRGSGVRSTLIEPAATDTELWDSIDYARHQGLPPRTAMLEPAAVAASVLHALTAAVDVAVRNIMVERA
jgi:NADP-dependent 3-hydroxy acid dehydrogenase YdfG